jgi:mannitol/fructose-specific phosphotransferase system IIA component
MAILSTDRIQLGAHAADRSDAIKQAGQLLVQTGCVTPEYIDGMLAREQSMSTYLGSGVSIPHGLFENREHILKTGISVLQIPAGVEWDEEGEKAHLVIGIAASSDEHVGVLASLAEAIEDEDTTRLLIETTDPNVIMKYLSGSQAE